MAEGGFGWVEGERETGEEMGAHFGRRVLVCRVWRVGEVVVAGETEWAGLGSLCTGQVGGLPRIVRHIKSSHKLLLLPITSSTLYLEPPLQFSSTTCGLKAS